MQANLHLRKRGSTYYFRRKIPEDISKNIGKCEITRSLRTKHYQLACTHARSISVICDTIFEALNQMADITKADIDKILDQKFEELFLKAHSNYELEKDLIKHRDTSMEDAVREQWADEHYEAMRKNDTSIVKGQVEEFCEEHNIEPQADPNLFAYVDNNILTKTAHYAIQVDNLYKDAEVPPSPTVVVSGVAKKCQRKTSAHQCKTTSIGSRE